MVLDEIRLRNYRNIADEKVSFSGGINILCGNNANGKTNLIEAVYQFSVGRSFRTKNFKEIINFEANECSLTLDFRYTDGRKKNLGIKFDRNKLKKYTVNGIMQEKISNFIGNFNSVLFTPDNLSIVKGIPELRRRFLDMAICQLKPVYIGVLNSYNQVLSQRNALIKQMKKQNLSDSKEKLVELSVWTDKLVSLAVEITAYRGEYTDKLIVQAPVFYDGLSCGREKLVMSYKTQVRKGDADFGDWKDKRKCAEMYTDIYEEGIRQEFKYGITLFGPHRDDLILEIDSKPARYFASQGQQRSAVLAMKLAEGDIMKEECGEYPLFLLDDITSELDSSRQNYIMEKLSGRQVLITLCNEEQIPRENINGEAKIIRVDNGKFI